MRFARQLYEIAISTRRLRFISATLDKNLDLRRWVRTLPPNRWLRDNSIWPIRNDCVMMEREGGGGLLGKETCMIFRCDTFMVQFHAPVHNYAKYFTSLFFFFSFTCYCLRAVVWCCFRGCEPLTPARLCCNPHISCWIQRLVSQDLWNPSHRRSVRSALKLF